jgi:uncharacterized membrane protein YeaQ/YmgE (transglycosylase-associated protein family)
MNITIDAEIVALIVLGLIAGTAAAAVFERGRQSSRSWLRNVLIGVLGALLGALIFGALDLEDDIPNVLTGAITVADMLIAVVCAGLLMVVARIIRR